MTLNSETTAENVGSDESALSQCLENSLREGGQSQMVSHIWEHDHHFQHAKTPSLIFLHHLFPSSILLFLNYVTYQ